MTINLRLQERDLETIPAKICRILREAIIKGEIKPGTRLIQDELSKSLGVSRMPIREAIKQLEAEGYVTVEPHKGAIVKEFSIEEIKEIYFLRSKFEPIAVRESLNHITAEMINELEELNKAMLDTDDIDTFIKLNITFHDLLIRKCPWGKLNNIIYSFWTGFPQQTPHLLPDQLHTSKIEHTEILDSIKKKNYDLTCTLIEKHISRAGNQVMQNILKK